MRVGVIEDEPLSAQEIVKLIHRYDPAIQVDPVLDTVRDTVAYLASNMPDLLFVDIELADGSSFDIFDHVDVTCPVVFTTAYDSYALKAFEQNSISYLLKPVTFSKLKSAFDKMETMTTVLQTDLKGAVEGYKERFLVKSGKKLLPINAAAIAYFHSQDNLTYLHTHEGKQYLTGYTLNDLELLLDPHAFLRVTRQYIASRSSVDHLQTQGNGQVVLHLNGGVQVTISREKTTILKEWLS